MWKRGAFGSVVLSHSKSKSTRSPGYRIPTEFEATPAIGKPSSTVIGVKVADETWTVKPARELEQH